MHVHSIISLFCFERNLDTSPDYMQPTAKLILTSTPPESSQDITADGQFRLVEGVSTDNPITVRSQSDLQSDHSPITVRSYVLLPFHITRLKRIYRFERGSFFFLWTSQVAGKIYDRTVIGLWSDCRSDCDRTVVGLLHGAHAREIPFRNASQS